MKKILIFVFFLTFLVAPPVLAAGLVPCGYDLDGNGTYDPIHEGCKLCHFFVMGQNIVNFFLFTIVPPLAVLMVVVGGGMFILGAGDLKLISQGKSILWSVAIGLIIIYGSWIFVDTFFVLVGLADWTGLGLPGGWSKINCPI